MATPTLLTLRELPDEEKPLYRVRVQGAPALNNAELLALLLGGQDNLELAFHLLAEFGSLHKIAKASRGQLLKVNGIGESLSARLLALLELSTRLQQPGADSLAYMNSPSCVAEYFMPLLRHLAQEELHVMCLNTRNAVIKTIPLYKGSLNTSVVRIGELFRHAVELNASGIIIAHNHPSGDPAPSQEDLRVTRQVVEAGKLLNIKLFDHIIIGNGRFCSLKEHGLVEF